MSLVRTYRVNWTSRDSGSVERCDFTAEEMAREIEALTRTMHERNVAALAIVKERDTLRDTLHEERVLKGAPLRNQVEVAQREAASLREENAILKNRVTELEEEVGLLKQDLDQSRYAHGRMAETAQEGQAAIDSLRWAFRTLAESRPRE